ncbi:hypothetical protein C1H46_044023 [Malus baccata]|uniref:Uncharacterized protein n=1 Tax=Malus baccata TaxID=106549 RepID=A0A540K8A1_MALBA|nr:hypothetical protein C1H46_044023 [Malus baccata]
MRQHRGKSFPPLPYSLSSQPLPLPALDTDPKPSCLNKKLKRNQRICRPIVEDSHSVAVLNWASIWLSILFSKRGWTEVPGSNLFVIIAGKILWSF